MDSFSALADPTRRRIVEMLASSGELSAGEISSRFESSPPAISQHLRILREADLVRVEKQAQRRIYSVNPQSFEEMWEWMNKMREFWNDSLDALDALLKSDNGTSNTGK